MHLLSGEEFEEEIKKLPAKEAAAEKYHEERRAKIKIIEQEKELREKIEIQNQKEDEESIDVIKEKLAALSHVIKSHKYKAMLSGMIEYFSKL